jgi:hypothetical protein
MKENNKKSASVLCTKSKERKFGTMNKKTFCVSIETYAYVEAENRKEAHDIVVRAINLDYEADPKNGVDFKQYQMEVVETETGKTWNDAEIVMSDEELAEMYEDDEE